MNQFADVTSLDELFATAKMWHAALAVQYYTLELLSKQEFDSLHGTLWDDFAEQYENIAPHVYMTDKELVEEYITTATATRKQEIIEELLGVRDRSQVRGKKTLYHV